MGSGDLRTSFRWWGRDEECLCRTEEACGLDCRAHDPLDPVVAYKCLPTIFVGDKDEFHRSFRGGEDWVGLVGLFVGGDKPHVPRQDPDEGRHVVVAADCGGVPWCVIPNKEYQDH